MRKACALLSIAFVLVVGCSSESDPGESCDEPGGTEDVCETGYVCAKPTSSAPSPVCIKTCVSDADCTGGTACNGVEGTNIKGCRAK
jgi:hypothetical protein